MRVAVVVPTYNEIDNIDELLTRLLALKEVQEIVVVDDNSPDGTASRVIAHSQSTDKLRLIARSGKLGLGSAYAAGMKLALAHGADAVVTMDADLSHDPQSIPALIAGLDYVDVMIGSRYVAGGRIENWGMGRRVLSRGANFLTRLILRIPAKDCTAGFRAYKREVLEEVDPASIRSHGYSYLEEVICRVKRAGFSIGETPITFRDRRAGESKISRSEIFKGAFTLFRLFFYT